MATFTLSNTAGEIDTGISRAYARIGDTGSSNINLGINNVHAGFGSSVSLGTSCICSGWGSNAIGTNVKNATNFSTEIGLFGGDYSRTAGIKIFQSGYIATSTPLDNTPYTDGGATAGEEPDGSIFRGSISYKLKTNGQLYAFYNSGGTIKSGLIASLA